MSQEKPTVVELKKEDRDLLKSAIDLISKKPAPIGPPVDSHNWRGALDCPDCGPKLREAVLKLLPKKNYECDGCGLDAGEESLKEEWNCPGCGTRTVRKR